MSSSLREQFLKAGLVSEKQVKEVKKQQYDAKSSLPKNKQPQVSEAKLAAAAAAEQKAERDRQLNKKRQDAEARKALAAQIRQIIEANRQPKGEDDVAYNFTRDNVLKRIYVSADVHKLITNGTLAIVAMGKVYELVTPDVVEKIRQRDPTVFVFRNEASTPAPAADDPYANYQIPDDLIW